MSIRESQAAALKRLLNFNSTSESTQLSWKVLVFDKHGRDIISSVLRVNDLFKAGVTLHLLLETERYALPDVPAIYFVEPTAANIARIGKDIANNLYQSWSINFTNPLTRALLEDLASKTLATSQRINQVYDQYLNFVSLESNIFSLEMPDVYHQFADPKVTEQQIDTLVGQIVDGLFCVFVTRQKLPIIRATRGNAAEMIAQRLDEKLRSYIQNTRNSTQLDTQERPVLVLLDRNIDLVSMFSHSWTYQCLINDTCGLNRSRVTVKSETGSTSYDIEPTDTFWQANMTLPFPEVADHLDAALTKYKQDAEKLTGTTDIDSIEPNTAHLKSALTSLPELTARKQTIDMHMNIATLLLKAIGDRGLAQLFEAEQTAGKQSKASILELINNKEFTQPADKLRLYLVYFLVSPSISHADQTDIEAALKEQGCDLSALQHIKHTKEISKMTLVTAANQAAPASHQGALFQKVTGITSSLTSHINQGTLSEGFGSIISGVKGFLPDNKTDLPLTKIAQSVLDPQANQDITSDYLSFDPKGSRGSLTHPPKRTAYEEAFLFTVGGGNYFEYANVLAWAEKAGKKITYGSTDMPSPSKFVDTCASLGST